MGRYRDRAPRPSRWASPPGVIPRSVVLPLDSPPWAFANAITVQENQAIFGRAVPRQSGTLVNLSGFCASDGDGPCLARVAIYSVAETRHKLWESDPVELPGGESEDWRDLGNPALEVEAGDVIELAVMAGPSDVEAPVSPSFVAYQNQLSLPDGYAPLDGAVPVFGGTYEADSFAFPATIHDADFDRSNVAVPLILGRVG